MTLYSLFLRLKSLFYWLEFRELVVEIQKHESNDSSDACYHEHELPKEYILSYVIQKTSARIVSVYSIQFESEISVLFTKLGPNFIAK